MNVTSIKSGTHQQDSVSGLRVFPRSDDCRTATNLGVLVPVYNEQYLIASSLARLAVLGESPLLDRIEVVVVDDGSSDQTPQAIEHFRAEIDHFSRSDKFSWVFVRHEKNSGKG